jgi:CHAT domain-containing protein
MGRSKEGPRASAGSGLILAAALLLPACGEPPPERPPDPASSLPSPGASQRIGGRQAHRYPIPLKARDYLHVIVRQKGIDLVVDVLDPNRRRLFQVDTPTGAFTEEHVFLLAGLSGIYRVEVRPFNPAVPAAAYEIRIAERRQATPDDRRRVAADRAFAEARELEDRHPRELPGRAVTLYWKAARLWQLVGDGPRQADAWFRLGLMHRAAGRPQEALTLFGKALPLRPAAGFPQDRALLLGEMGVTLQMVGELRAARERFLEALALYDQAPFARGRAAMLVNLGGLYRQQGQTLEALGSLEQARSLLRGQGGAESEAKVLNEMGAVYTSLGETGRALQLHEQALRRLDRQRNPALWASTLNHKGNAHLEAGELDAAATAYQEALVLRSQATGRYDEAISLTGLAAVAVRRNETWRALGFLRRALNAFEEQGERLAAAIVRNDLGWLHGKRGELGKAFELHRQAWQTAHDLHYADLEAAALFGMALAERRRGNLDAARGHIQAALTAVEMLRRGTLRADLRTSVLASRQDYYGFLVDLLMELHRRRPDTGYDALAFGVSEQGRARVLLDALAEDREELLRGISPELIERQKRLQQELQDQEEMRLQGTVRDVGPQVLADVRRRQEATLTAWYAAEEEIRKASPWYASLSIPRSLALSEIQRRVVDRDTLLLEIHLGQPHSVLWVVAPDALYTFRLPSRATLERMARQTWELLAESRELTNEAPARRAAAELSWHLLGPAARLLGTRKLVVVAPGALQYVPFAALPEPAPPGADSAPPLLVERHEIVQLPSASVLAALRQRAGRPPPPGLIAMVADPVFNRDDERLQGRAASAIPPSAAWATGLPPFDRLPHSAEEARTILALAAGRPLQSFLGFEADRRLVLSGRLARFRILHFSTHSWIDAEHPELSALMLSTFDAKGRPQDGRLRMHEIYGLKLPADLVVLSGCQTATGREIAGEGLVGIASGFLYAGAEGILGSLWNVSDRSTAELMRRFYEGLLIDHLSPAAALQQAQRSMLAEEAWRTPSHWAGFVLVGNGSGRF